MSRGKASCWPASDCSCHGTRCHTAAVPSPPTVDWTLKPVSPSGATVSNLSLIYQWTKVTKAAYPVGNPFQSQSQKCVRPMDLTGFHRIKPHYRNNQGCRERKEAALCTRGQNAYPYFPKSDTVVPPTGTALPGPYTSHIVRAAWAFLGRSGYFTGSFNHSFQLWEQSQQNTYISLFQINPQKIVQADEMALKRLGLYAKK